MSKWSVAALSLGCVVAVSNLVAATPKDTQTGDLKWTTTSSLQSAGLFTQEVQDPHRVFCEIELSYALWTLLGEPVHDYLVKLVPCKDSGSWALSESTSISIATVNSDWPDLTKQVRATAPLEMIFEAHVEFYDATDERIATGVLWFSPDLLEPPGTVQKLSTPGSPEWENWFQSVSCARGVCPFESKDPVGVRLKKAWTAATKVTMVRLHPIYIKWPEQPFQSLLDAVVTTQESSNITTKDFWSQAPKLEKPKSTAATIGGLTADLSRMTGKRAPEKERARFAKANLPDVVDASSGATLAVQLPQFPGTKVLVNGATAPVSDNKLTLKIGVHDVQLVDSVGARVFQVECGAVPSKFSPMNCSPDQIAGLTTLPPCSQVCGSAKGCWKDDGPPISQCRMKSKSFKRVWK